MDERVFANVLWFKYIHIFSGEKQYKFEEILPIYKAVSGETDTGSISSLKFELFTNHVQCFYGNSST